jgi:GH24 family phage-related lysozyme (muramidase)
MWLAYLENERRRELARRWPPFLNQPEDVQDALVCLAYQLGTEGLLGFHLMLGALARGDREAAALNLLDSNLARTDAPARTARMADLLRGHPAEADD